MDTEILTFEETREFLKVSKSTLYRLVQNRQIPCSKVGRSWRFRKERLIKWMDREEKIGGVK